LRNKYGDHLKDKSRDKEPNNKNKNVIVLVLRGRQYQEAEKMLDEQLYDITF
jgi:hypothetical protein